MLKKKKNPNQNNNKNPQTQFNTNNLSLLKSSWQYILASFCSADAKEKIHTGNIVEVFLVRNKKTCRKCSFFMLSVKKLYFMKEW